jgi:hypothetical protein
VAGHPKEWTEPICELASHRIEQTGQGSPSLEGLSRFHPPFTGSETMSKTNEIKISVSDYALTMLDSLQTELECSTRSQLVELLILSQKHGPREAWALLDQRPKRGRRWPAATQEAPVASPGG